LVFIFDSYDELVKDCIGKNLYHSNRLEKWRRINKANYSDLYYPKVIFTTRSEILSG